MSDLITSRPERKHAFGPRRRWVRGLVVTAAFLAGGLTVSGLSAVAADAGMHGAMGAPHHGHTESMAHMKAMLGAVGATAEQQAKIETILHDGLRPMMEAHGDMHDMHGGLMRLLTAPTIDRGALEQMRAAEIARLDQASRTATQALADAAEVLSTDQRAKLASMMAAQHHPTT